MPRFVKVGLEPKASSVLYEPPIDHALSLECAISVFGVYRFSTDVQIERSACEVRTVVRKPRTSAVRRLLREPLLILSRAISRDNLQKLFIRGKLTAGIH